MDTVRTVGELLSLLQTLPAETPIFSPGAAGGWDRGIQIQQGQLARHKFDPSYVADLTDNVWAKKKKQFSQPFPVLAVY